MNELKNSEKGLLKIQPRSTEISYAELQTLELRAQILADLYSPPFGENTEGFEPHDGQRLILNDFFVQGKERVLGVCGRNWGKTEEILHIDARICLTRECIHPNYPMDQIVSCYYVAPSRTLAREIIFNTGRIQRCVPKKYIWDITSTPDKAIWFTLDGIEPCGVVYIVGTEDAFNLIGVKHAGPIAVDEFAFTKRAWHKAKEQDFKMWTPRVMLFTTWPHTAPHFVDEFVQEYKQTPQYSFHQRPQTDNVFLERNNPGFFVRQKEEYERRGEEIDYQRDVLSIRVIGGASQIFPKFNAPSYFKACQDGIQDLDTLEIKHKEIYDAIMAEVRDNEHVWPDYLIPTHQGEDRKYLKRAIHFDPGHSKVFAVNFYELNPFTKVLYVRREIYEKKVENLGTRDIWRLVIGVMLEIWPDDYETPVEIGYDEAAKWFQVETRSMEDMVYHQDRSQWAEKEITLFTNILVAFPEGISLTPTNKKISPESSRISTVRDMLAACKLVFSDRASFSIWEMMNFRLDDHGEIPDEHDHTIDNLRYVLDLLNYNFDCEKRCQPLPEVLLRLQERDKGNKKSGFEDWEAESWR